MVHRFFPALALLLALAACKSTGPIGPIVSGSDYDIAAVPLVLTARTPLSVAVSVVDRRPYVLDGDESPKFLGTERAAWSQSVNLSTLSGRGLAEDLTDLIAGALTNAGVSATPVPLSRGAGEAEALAAFQAQGADRLLSVRILEWRSDSYTRVIMKWRFEATVLDRAGTPLGRSSAGGNAPVGGTIASDNGEAIAKREMSRQLTNLLGDPAIARALR